MTDAEREEIEKLKKRIDMLEGIIVTLLKQNAKTARSAARRLNNMLERESRVAEMYDDLAASVTAVGA